jgi:hypothetical protein
MVKKLTYFLIISFFFFQLGLTFHHHDDHVSNTDCSLCFYASHHIGLTPQHNADQFVIPFSFLPLIQRNEEIISTISRLPFWNRAPPA